MKDEEKEKEREKFRNRDRKRERDGNACVRLNIKGGAMGMFGESILGSSGEQWGEKGSGERRHL